MNGGVRFSVLGALALVTLAGCGRGFFQTEERAPWRHEAEETCLKSGAVKLGAGAVQIEPIEGPGACGMDFPLKVTELGESAPAMSFADDMRPPASIPAVNSNAMPRWPGAQSDDYPPPARIQPVQSHPVAAPTSYSPPAQVYSQPAPQPIQRGNMRWVPGPQPVNPPPPIEQDEQAGEPMTIAPPNQAVVPPTYSQPRYAPPLPPAQSYPQPRYVPAAPARTMPDDIPDDAKIPSGGSAAVPGSGTTYNAPVYTPPPQRELPRLGPPRAPYNGGPIPQAGLTPPATLACPIVSALDRWVSEGVQPAALHWFGSPVVTIKQISAYSCRHMVGGSGVSEHSYGNALDIAAFTLADGRTITVEHGWHGTAEEQGFLHDVQLYACETFTTVLAPGYNIYHYNHIHVDLMRRQAGYRPCRPNAIPGEQVAAQVRARYANKHAPAYTGSIAAKDDKAIVAVPGEDGYVDDKDDDTAVASPRLAHAPAKTNATIFAHGAGTD